MGKAHRAVVFGVFDRFHPGHLAFLAQARAKADEVIAIVARDASVKRLKNRMPKENERVRKAAVEKSGLVRRAVLGDAREGEYKALRRLAPDLVVLGYDQDTLFKDIRQRIRSGLLRPTPIVKAKPYLPERYHTTLLTF